MRFAWLLRFLLLFFAVFALNAQALPWKKTEAVKAELLSQTVSVRPGSSIRLGVLLTQQPGWHTYWKTPGDTGLPTTIDWTLPEGWNAGPIQWPTPKLYVLGDLTNFGYENSVLLPVSISVPSSAKEGDHIAKANVSWLMCAEQCIPGSASLEIFIKVSGAGPAASPNAGLFQTNEALTPTPLTTTSAQIDPTNHALSVTFKSSKPFNHFYVFTEGEGAVDYKAPQSVSKKGDEITVRLQGTEELKEGDTLSGVFAADGGPTQGGWSGSFSHVLDKGTVIPPTASSDNSDVNLTVWLAAGMSFLGGLILNLMPCVFPVLSLKMLSLVEHRREGNLALHGLSFTVGVLISMTFLAGALIAVKSAGASVGWGFQLQSPWFVALLALLFVTITLNLAGAFEFSGVRISSKTSSRASVAGSFATGILAVVVASPCTAPFMGAALGYALSASPIESFVVFICLGFGMSLPWLLLSFFPFLTAWLPRPGRWMIIFRTVMAVPMALTAVWLFWVLCQQVSASSLGAYLAAAICLAFAFILYGRIQFGKPASKGAMIFAFVLCGAVYAVAASPLLQSAPAEKAAADAWSPEAVQTALDEGRPVFVDFTASWCVTCQANKLAVLDRENVQKAFQEKNVKFLIADWTNRNAEISKTLESFGRTGVPLYLLYAPDGTAKILPELLTQDIVIEALKALPKRSSK